MEGLGGVGVKVSLVISLSLPLVIPKNSNLSFFLGHYKSRSLFLTIASDPIVPVTP